LSEAEIKTATELVKGSRAV